MDSNGWEEWRKYVLKKLEQLEDQYVIINKQLQDIEIAIATLKVKAGLWGAVGAIIPIVSFILVQTVVKKLI